MTARLLAAATVAVLVVALAGCADEGRLEVRAVFDEVIDLTTNAAVQVADVRVGVVEDIELTEDNDALVTMSVDRDVTLPSRVSARLRKTNVLGERFVELVPDAEAGGRFPDGGLIMDTAVVPELEDVVGTGSEVFAAIAADTVAGAIEAGAEGLGGRGRTLNTTIDDLTEVVATYEDNTDDIERLVDGLDAFLADVGPEAEVHGEAVAELSRFARVVAEEDDRLLDTLGELRALSRSGSDLIATHRQRMDDFFTRFDRISSEVVAHEEDLSRLFTDVAMHNRNTIEGINTERAQVILDFIVCGVNDEPDDPVRSCEEHAPTGQPPPQPRPPQDY